MRIISSLLVGLGLTLSACNAADAPSNTKTTSEISKGKAWNLRGAESSLSFISVKKGTIVEVHNFTDISGAILPDGGAVILVKLDSVETNIDIRNERMRTYLFETDKLPSAMIKAQLDPAAFASMEVGARKDIEIPVDISMHGHNDTVDVAIVVTRLSANKVVVESRTPLVIDVADFGMSAGVEKLRELAKLPSITPEVPVMFSLVFER